MRAEGTLPLKNLHRPSIFPVLVYQSGNQDHAVGKPVIGNACFRVLYLAIA